MGKVLDLNTNLLLLGKWPRSSPVVPRALFACFSSFVCPISVLQPSIGKLNIVGTASFLNANQQGLKESRNKLLTVRFCSKLSSVKSSAQTNECFESVKHSLFISISKVLTLDFECLISPETHSELEINTVSMPRISHQQ